MSANTSRRSSGLDFSDANNPQEHLREQHPDLADSNVSGAALQRNRTERRRLQGMQKTQANTVNTSTEPKTFLATLNIWLINEGGRQLFFGVWIFLHLLVAVFGFINYQLKDNLVTARAAFGITFCA